MSRRLAASVMEPAFGSVLGAEDRAAYRERVTDFCRRLGFDRMSAMLVTDQPAGRPLFDTVHNAPDGYLAAFFDVDRQLTDPVMQHCKHNHLPLVWDRATYVAAGLENKWEEQAAFGYRCGIAVVMHMPRGRHYFLGVDRDQPLPRDASEVTSLVATLQVFAVHAHEAANRTWKPNGDGSRNVALTARELETLRWTIEGQTAHEVASHMGISERTAALHLMRATRKLGCANKLQAAVRAVQWGLL